MEKSLPWDDCKVAFGFDGDDLGFWALCDEQHREWRWPHGWEPNETDSRGARMVVVFRVEGPSSIAAGQGVRRILDAMQTELLARAAKEVEDEEE